MPQQLFAIKNEDLINLTKFYKRLPKQFARASASVLTSFAFGTRQKSIKIIKNRMNVRNERFITSSIKVEKANGNIPLGSQSSKTGSIERTRFTGLVEQELGTKSKRTRTSTLFARGGNESKQIRPSFRMKPGNQFKSPDDFAGESNQHRAIVMLQTLSREKFKKPFVIKGHKKFKTGLYKLHRNKIKRIQEFKNKVQPKRVKWLSGGRKLYFGVTNIGNVWAESLKRTLRFK